MDEYSNKIKAMHDRIADKLGRPPVVYYSAYRTKDCLPLDNLDEVAVEGDVKFVANYEPFWGSGSPYESPVVSSPTWLDVAVLCDDMIRTTGDYHHHFLEGITLNDDGTAKFMMGS